MKHVIDASNFNSLPNTVIIAFGLQQTHPFGKLSWDMLSFLLVKHSDHKVLWPPLNLCIVFPLLKVAGLKLNQTDHKSMLWLYAILTQINHCKLLLSQGLVVCSSHVVWVKINSSWVDQTASVGTGKHDECLPITTSTVSPWRRF